MANFSNETLELEVADDFNKTNNVDMFYFYEVEQFVLLSILFTAIVIGNTSVILVLFYAKTRKSRMNYFIRQLAIADLSVGVMNVFTDIIWRITISWYAGNLACKLIRYLQTVVTYASTYVLVALSIDRYDAIKNPMHFRSNWKRAKILIGTAWVLSFIFSSPILLLYEEKQVQDRPQCWIELTNPIQWQIYMILVVLTVFLLPTIIIVTCYAFILSIIWNKKALLLSTKTNQDMIVSSEGIIPKAKIKTVKVTLVIVSVFIVCWSPYMIFDLLQVFGMIPNTQTNIAIATFIQSLAPLNSAANPLIYFVFSRNIIKTIRRSKLFHYITCGKYPEKPQEKTRSSTDTMSMSEGFTSSSRNTRSTNSRLMENRISRL